jgi:hypothetical protein
MGVTTGVSGGGGLVVGDGVGLGVGDRVGLGVRDAMGVTDGRGSLPVVVGVDDDERKIGTNSMPEGAF